jgi:hypothetical protein
MAYWRAEVAGYLFMSITAPKTRLRWLAGALLCSLTLSGCFARGTPPPPQTPTATFDPLLFPTVVSDPGSLIIEPTATAQQFDFATPTFGAPLPTVQPIQFPTVAVPVGDPISVWMAFNAPVELQMAMQPLFATGRFIYVANEFEARVKLVSLPAGSNAALESVWVYVPVVSFNAAATNLSLANLERFWRGDLAALADLNGGNSTTLITTAPIYYWLTLRLGPPPPTVPVQVLSPESVSAALFANTNSLGLIPFDRVDSTVRPLTLDGQNIFQAALNLQFYPLSERFGLTGDPALINETVAALNSAQSWINTNRAASRLQ